MSLTHNILFCPDILPPCPQKNSGPDGGIGPVHHIYPNKQAELVSKLEDLAAPQNEDESYLGSL